MSEPVKEKKKNKVTEFLTRVYLSAENGLKALKSNRVYFIAALVYIAVHEVKTISDLKFLGLCGVACMFIFSEDKRKLNK